MLEEKAERFHDMVEIFCLSVLRVNTDCVVMDLAFSQSSTQNTQGT